MKNKIITLCSMIGLIWAVAMPMQAQANPFFPESTVFSGSGPSATGFGIATADLNADGYTDLYLNMIGVNGVSTFLNTAGTVAYGGVIGGFALGNSYLAIGDVTGDGTGDLILPSNTAITVSPGLATGSFNPATQQAFVISPVVTPGVTSLISTDFDGDGRADVAYTLNGRNNVYIRFGQVGTFLSAETVIPVGAGARGLSTGDFDGDGRIDMAVVNSTDATVSILKGGVAGSFFPLTTLTTATNPSETTVGDFNGDGKADLAVAVGNNVTVFLATTGLNFAAGVDFPNGQSLSSIITGDFNGDGNLDVASVNGGGSGAILYGDGSGSFAAAINFPTLNFPFDLVTVDINNDGYTDIATANSKSGASVGLFLRKADPLAPTMTVPTGGTINTSMPTLNLTCNDNVGCTQLAFSNDNITWTPTVATPVVSGAAWSGTASWALPAGQGAKTMYVQFSDAAGNTTVKSIVYTVDTVAPAVPVITSPVFHYGNTTARPTISGTAEASAIVNVYDNGTFLGSATSNGSWSLSGGATLVGASHSFTATATDAAGNLSATSAAFAYTVDTVAPVITAPANFTKEATAIHTPVSLAELGTATTTEGTVSNSIGVNAISSALLPVGTTTVTWTAVDLAGNTATATQTVTITDTTAPVIAGGPVLPTVTSAGVYFYKSTLEQFHMPAASDIFTVAITNDAPDTFPDGTTVVTWTATDLNGNASTATQQVIVSGTPNVNSGGSGGGSNGGGGCIAPTPSGFGLLPMLVLLLGGLAVRRKQQA